jgi:hypothetical protein
MRGVDGMLRLFGMGSSNIFLGKGAPYLQMLVLSSFGHYFSAWQYQPRNLELAARLSTFLPH